MTYRTWLRNLRSAYVIYRTCLRHLASAYVIYHTCLRHLASAYVIYRTCLFRFYFVLFRTISAKFGTTEGSSRNTHNHIMVDPLLSFLPSCELLLWSALQQQDTTHSGFLGGRYRNPFLEF